ncbi:MAG: NAD-dependent epimerase/dehydratase family protein [Desulfitobacteriaceae bacterium]|nr:NAD-dependent epimerase/dehydratase family protein [Desulfitobacteriaceae bacterium]MDD3945102.1 NAD-dependent epimerase/dehydratase family protein [Bacteroidales bacterium]
MNIIITGASGFVGSHLVAHLAEKGHTINVLDLGQSVPDCVRQSFHWDRLDQVDLGVYDVMIHLAGIAHDVRGKANEDLYMKVNYGLTKEIFTRFLEARSGVSGQKAKARSFIFFSTVKAVADRVDGEVLTEEAAANPVGPYGKSKFKAEQFIREALEKASGGTSTQPVNIYILRPAMIHGPGNKGNLNLLYQVVRRGIPWPLGAFDNKRSFTSVRNLCVLVERVSSGGIPSGVYNVADDVPVSTNRLIELICQSLGKRPKIMHLSPRLIRGFARIGDMLHLPLNSLRLQKLTEDYVVSNRKLKDALGIDALPYTTEDELLLTLESFKD